MADYWKSTPKYWCKHCNLYVRDTPLEKRNHESSPRHQGNLQRFVKELHKTNAREERESQRAKDEAARLNGVQPSATKSTPRKPAPSSSSASGPKQAPKATPEERRRQMAQLAAMGVAVPEGFRRENAMAGDWETVAIHPVAPAPPPRPKPDLKKEESDDEFKPGLVDSSLTERKRKLDDGNEEMDLGSKGKRKPNWGSDVKQQRDLDADNDLDALLAGSSAVIGQRLKKSVKHEADEEQPTVAADESVESGAREEPEVLDTKSSPPLGPNDGERNAKGDDANDDVGSMFKKRRKKTVKHDS